MTGKPRVIASAGNYPGAVALSEVAQESPVAINGLFMT